MRVERGGDLGIGQAMGDERVLFQDTAAVVDKLIRAKKDVDVVWGEVLVRLGSDENFTEWHLTTENLWGDGQTSWTSSESVLNGVPMTCSVLDLQGNSAVDAGDTVEVAVLQTDGAFDPDADYTMSFVYLPTGEVIYSGTFAGAP